MRTQIGETNTVGAQAGIWLVLGLIVVLVTLAGPVLSDDSAPVSKTAVVSNVWQSDMLEADQQMLERMRVATQPNMGTMIKEDPMWIDPEMIRLQEEYQAQFDRMLARRTGRR